MLVLGLENRKTIDKALKGIADGLDAYQKTNRLSDAEMAKLLAVSHATYKKIKDGVSVKRSTEEVLWMMMLAGMWR